MDLFGLAVFAVVTSLSAVAVDQNDGNLVNDQNKVQAQQAEPRVSLRPPTNAIMTLGQALDIYNELVPPIVIDIFIQGFTSIAMVFGISLAALVGIATLV